MRKTLIISLIAMLSVVLAYGFADAKVSGACYKCHTMHNSQAGTDVYSGGAQVHLLNNTCLGCHTTTTSDPLEGGYPRVQLTSGSDTNSLAGGFFTSGDPGNHNGQSHSLGSMTLPVRDGGLTYRDTAYSAGTAGLSCAGTSGCHGDSSKPDPGAAISGGHHGTSAAMGYRMLVAKGPTKVRGTGASDYEKALIASGGSSGARNHYSAGTAGDSISEFCATCHGTFHGVVGSSGAWTRHPTDVAIPTSWEIYTDFTNKWTNNGSASVKHPLGFTGDTETNGTAQVICLSCHRAHGTAHNNLLRWDYDLMSAGSTTVKYGCLGCHNKQRG